MEKLGVKNGDYLQYLLNKNGYVIIKGFDAEEAIRQVTSSSLASFLSSVFSYHEANMAGFKLNYVLIMTFCCCNIKSLN